VVLSVGRSIFSSAKWGANLNEYIKFIELNLMAPNIPHLRVISIEEGLSSTGFSLWGLGFARTKFHRLKPVLLKPSAKIYFYRLVGK
jgi:hypothetical protein